MRRRLAPAQVLEMPLAQLEQMREFEVGTCPGGRAVLVAGSASKWPLIPAHVLLAENMLTLDMHRCIGLVDCAAQVVLHNAKTEEVGRFRLCLHRDMVVGDVLRLLRERAGASWASKPLRLLQVRDSELFKVRRALPSAYALQNLTALHLPCTMVVQA